MQSKYTYQVWDGLSAINGISAGTWRSEYDMSQGQLAYILYKDGVMTHFQAWNPFEAGRVELTAENIDVIAKKHVEQEEGKEAEYINSLTDGKIINLANSYVLEYNFATGGPRANAVTIDNTDPKIATKMFITNNTVSGIDAAGVLSMIEPGARIQIREKLDNRNYMVFRVDERPKLGTDNLDMEVSFLWGEGQVPFERVIVNVMPPATGQGARRVVHEFGYTVDSSTRGGFQPIPATHPVRRWNDCHIMHTTNTANNKPLQLVHKTPQTNSPEVVWVNPSGMIFEGNLETGETRMLIDLFWEKNNASITAIAAYQGVIYFTCALWSRVLFAYNESSKRIKTITMPIHFNRIYGVIGDNLIMGTATAAEQFYAYNIPTGLVSVLGAKPEQVHWQNACIKIYKNRLYIISYGASKESWYFDFITNAWNTVSFQSVMQLPNDGDCAVDHETGDFYYWRAGVVEKINLDTMRHTPLGTIDWPTANADIDQTGLYYKGRCTTMNRMFKVGDSTFRFNPYLPWSNLNLYRTTYTGIDNYFWYWNANQIMRINWDTGEIWCVFSVVKQIADSYAEYGQANLTSTAIAERNGYVYVAGQYPFVVNTKTKESKIIKIGEVAISGSAVAQASSFAALLMDEIALIGCGVSGENTGYDRVVIAREDGTGEYSLFNWGGGNTNTNKSDNIPFVMSEKGLIARNVHNDTSGVDSGTSTNTNFRNPLISSSTVLTGINVNNTAAEIGTPGTAIVGYFNVYTEIWYYLVSAGIFMQPESSWCFMFDNRVASNPKDGITASTVNSNVIRQAMFNPLHGYVIIPGTIWFKLIFPEAASIQKVGKVRRGQVLDFAIGSGGRQSYCMIPNGRRYNQGRSIIQEDGDLYAVVFPPCGSSGVAAAKTATDSTLALQGAQMGSSWIKGWIEEA